jgi:decaprenylphospho-beta-D-erythro-pentofuranosid-2-ulose 2-reductase
MSGSVLILGATSAIARAVAAQFAAEKCNLLLAGRNATELQKTARDLEIRFQVQAAVVPFDALDFTSHPAFFATCLEQASGELTGVVLCHGYMADQQLAQKDFAEAQRMIDTNYTSAVSILNLCANHFEEKRKGFVCAISSVAGDRGRQSNYLYGSTKAALDAYLEGMRVRLAKAGVPVLTVKPGFVDTRMTWGLKGMFLVASPEHVARDIHRAIRRKKNVIYTPWFWAGIMAIIRNIPRFIFKKMKM